MTMTMTMESHVNDPNWKPKPGEKWKHYRVCCPEGHVVWAGDNQGPPKDTTFECRRCDEHYTQEEYFGTETELVCPLLTPEQEALEEAHALLRKFMTLFRDSRGLLRYAQGCVCEHCSQVNDLLEKVQEVVS